EFRDARRPLVDLRVVFHRARPERVKLRVDAEVPLREPEEVAIRLRLAHLWQPGRVAPRERSVGRARIDVGGVELRNGIAAPLGGGALEGGGRAELAASGAGSGRVCFFAFAAGGGGGSGLLGSAFLFVVVVPNPPADVARAGAADRGEIGLLVALLDRVPRV